MVIYQIKLKLLTSLVLAPKMPQLTPFTRGMMQTLKADKDEEARQEKIKNVVHIIYNATYTSARNDQATSYNYAIPSVGKAIRKPWGLSFPADPFYLENMPDILRNLQELFLGCDISHSIMAKGTDGKLYDVSKLDESVLPFVDRALDQSYIVIDWS